MVTHRAILASRDFIENGRVFQLVSFSDTGRQDRLHLGLHRGGSLGPFPPDLVSRRSDYDGLVQSEDGQVLGCDEELDGAGDARLLVDQSQVVEGLDHLVD